MAPCIRFKKIEEFPLRLIGRAIKRVPVKMFNRFYESARETAAERKRKKLRTQEGRFPSVP